MEFAGRKSTDDKHNGSGAGDERFESSPADPTFLEEDMIEEDMSEENIGVANPFGMFHGLAQAHHELYMSYIEAGFPPDHAIQMTIVVVSIYTAKS